MPYDTTIGYQLSGEVEFTPVLGVYQAYPYKAETAGTYVSGHPLEGDSYAAGTITSYYKWEEAAAAEYSMLDYEPIEWGYDTGTVTVSAGTANFAGGASLPTWVGADPRQYLSVGSNYWQIASKTNSTRVVLVDSSASAASSAYKLIDYRWRETDPSKICLSAIAAVHAEFADPLARIMQQASLRGSKIGCYGELFTHQYARILDILDDSDTGTYKEWLDDFNATATLKCWNGQSLIEMFSSLGGKIFVPAYVPSNAHQTSDHLRKRYRKFVRRMLIALRNVGANPVPIILPYTIDTHGTWISTGSGTRINTALLNGLITDANSICGDGEWGVWGVQRETSPGVYQNQADATFIAGLP